MSRDRTKIVASIVEWWRALHGLDDTRADAAGRAQLRRAETVLDALLLRQTQHLLRIAGASRRDGQWQERLAVLAITLAGVRAEPGEARFASLLGRKSDGAPATGDDPRLFSPRRFGALVRTARDGEPDDLALHLRRAIALLKDRPFDVEAFVGDVLWLNERTLRNWTYDYWQSERPPATHPDSNRAPNTEARL